MVINAERLLVFIALALMLSGRINVPLLLLLLTSMVLVFDPWEQPLAIISTINSRKKIKNELLKDMIDFHNTEK